MSRRSVVCPRHHGIEKRSRSWLLCGLLVGSLGCTDPRAMLELGSPDTSAPEPAGSAPGTGGSSGGPGSGGGPTGNGGAGNGGSPGGATTGSGGSSPTDARPPGADGGSPAPVDAPIVVPSDVVCGASICVQVPNGSPSCTATNTCSFTCNAGAVQCRAIPACEKMSWSFDTSLDGWTSKRAFEEFDPARQGTTISTAQFHGGTGAAAAVLELDPTTLPKRDQYALSLEFCSTDGGYTASWSSVRSLDLLGKTLSAWVLVSPDNPALVRDVTCYVTGGAGNDQEVVVISPTQPGTKVALGQWREVRAVFTAPASATARRISISCVFDVSAPQRATIYIDDITLQ